MDIKSKNKYFNFGALILCLFLMSIALLSGIDFWSNRSYLKLQPYFSSTQFENELSRSFDNVARFYTTYRNYAYKTDDEKIDRDELDRMRENYDIQLKNKLNTTEDKYNQEITAAEENKNTDRAKRLIEERDKKLEEIKKEDTKTVEDIKKELVNRNTKDYEAIKKALESKSSIKYYITLTGSNEILTNINGLNNIGEYIKNSSLYSLDFPRRLNQQSRLNSINNFFNSQVATGYVIIPNETEGYSYYTSNYKYYNSLRTRIIFEFFLTLGALTVSLLMLKYLKSSSGEVLVYNERFNKFCSKIPIDLKLAILLFYSLFIFKIVSEGGFMTIPPTSRQFRNLLIVAIYFLVLNISFPFITTLVKDKDKLKAYWEESLALKVIITLMNAIKTKGMLFRVGVMTLIAVVAAGIIGLLTLLVTNNEGAALFVVLAYCIIVLIYIILKLKYLDVIIIATDEIAAGNLNFSVKEKGKGLLSKLANNINNLQSGVKKAVESQMKSDRLKSELITNVSHDLKTPLTSIINYVDLLKREELTKEEMLDYIGVLDRKTQRLKVLIEDLFEASKMASGSVELNLEKVDVAQLLTQSLGEFDEKIKASSLAFRVNIPHGKVFSILDGKKTWRVFENLIGNILKYSQTNTRVYIELIENETNIIITMKNISAYEMDFNVDELFERFKRGDASRATEGSGLGLAIAKSIVDLQGGKLNIEIDGDLFKAIVEFKK